MADLYTKMYSPHDGTYYEQYFVKVIERRTKTNKLKWQHVFVGRTHDW